MSEKPVAISFPQFIMEDSYDLNSVLQDMGIRDVFDGTKADLTGISKSPSLHLSKVVHKTFVEVDEMGTQAAAASGAVVAEKALPSGVEFNANHPFLFFIRHNGTQSLLFCGRVYSPWIYSGFWCVEGNGNMFSPCKTWALGFWLSAWNRSPAAAVVLGIPQAAPEFCSYPLSPEARSLHLLMK